MSRRMSKAKLVIDLEEAEASVLKVMLNKGYQAIQIELDEDEVGSTLTIGALIDSNEDNPPCAAVRIVEGDKELSYEELLVKLGVGGSQQKEESSVGNCDYYGSEPIPF